MKNSGAKITTIPVTAINKCYFERSNVENEDIRELADSIKTTKGSVQPIIVRPNGKNTFELIAGYRRFLATKKAGIKSVEAKVMPLNDNDALQVCLIENIQRKELTPIDTAQLLKRMVESGKSYSQIGFTLGKTKVWVSQILSLLNAPTPVKEAVAQGDITATQGLEIAKVGDEKTAKELVKKAIGGTVKTVKAEIQKVEAQQEKTTEADRIKAEIQEYRDKIAEAERHRQEKEALKKRLSALEKDYEKSPKNIPQDVDKMLDKLTLIQNEYQPLIRDIAQLDSDINRFSGELKKIDVGAVDKKAKDGERKINQLSERIKTLKQQISEAIAERNLIWENIKTAKQQVKRSGELKALVEKLEKQKDHLSKKEAEIKRKYKAEIRNFDNLKKTYSGHKNVLVQREKIFNEINEVKRKISEHTGKSNNITTYQKKIAELEKTLKKSDKKNSKSKNTKKNAGKRKK